MIVTYDHNNRLIVRAGKSYWRGRLSTVDLIVLTSLDQLLFKLKILWTFFTKQANIMRRSTVSSLPPHLVFPGTGRRCLSVTVILIFHISLFAGSSLLAVGSRYLVRGSWQLLAEVIYATFVLSNCKKLHRMGPMPKRAFSSWTNGPFQINQVPSKRSIYHSRKTAQQPKFFGPCNKAYFAEPK